MVGVGCCFGESIGVDAGVDVGVCVLGWGVAETPSGCCLTVVD